MNFISKLEMFEKDIKPEQIEALLSWATKNRPHLKKWSTDELAYMIERCVSDFPRAVIPLIAPELYLLIQSGNTQAERYAWRVSQRGVHEEWRSSDADHRQTYERRTFLKPVWADYLENYVTGEAA